jgi:hypothetical protein
MNALPSDQQHYARFYDHPHGSANLAAGHAVCPNQFWHAVGTGQVDLGLAVTEHVNMGRMVIVNEDHHSQAFGTQDGNHDAP